MAIEGSWDDPKLTLRSWRTPLYPSKDGSTLPSTAARQPLLPPSPSPSTPWFGDYQVKQ